VSRHPGATAENTALGAPRARVRAGPTAATAARREYITGFRKRKQARRKEALTKLEKRERQQRIDDRAEVRGPLLRSL
jgi:hypothetical protein